MPEATPRTLNHFAMVSFTDRYWGEPADERRRIHRAWLAAVRQAAGVSWIYQAFGLQARNDLLVWCAAEADAPDAAACLFAAWAAATAPYRAHLVVRDVLWGFTRQSQYTKTRSQQELDPFAPGRLPYLVVYPFVKTTEWYLTSQEDRQAMMAGHIRVGKQYKDITQLLLYSFGLQDQEFVVVYETRDLMRFMTLVNDLRATEARRFTLRDWPLHAGIHQPDDAALAKWL
jgi:chlorite dismutase